MQLAGYQLGRQPCSQAAVPVCRCAADAEQTCGRLEAGQPGRQANGRAAREQP